MIRVIGSDVQCHQNARPHLWGLELGDLETALLQWTSWTLGMAQAIYATLTICSRRNRTVV